MTDNIPRINPVITAELDAAIERHPAGNKQTKPKGPPKGTPNPVYAKKRAEEAQRAKRFSADTKISLAVLLALTAIVATASFAISFNGLYAAAEWGLGVTWLQIAVPVVLDVAIIAFTYSLFIERERGESTLWTLVLIFILAGVSTYANALHTIEVSTAVNQQQLIFGIVLSGGMPVLLAIVTDKIGAKVFRKVER